MEKSKFTVKDLTQLSPFTALISILALISITLPFSPVPVSGQTPGVMLSVSTGLRGWNHNISRYSGEKSHRSII